jgi:hypothetical protein
MLSTLGGQCFSVGNVTDFLLEYICDNLARIDVRLKDIGAGIVRLRYAGKYVDRRLEVRLHVTRAMVGPLQVELQRSRRATLLVTEYLTPPIADALRLAQVEFVDAAGNAFLRLPTAIVSISGRRRVARSGTQRTAPRSAFEPSGLRVIFALLAEPDALNGSYREIAWMADVSHGTVGWVMADLKRRGFIVAQAPRGPRKLTKSRQLAEQWVQAYATTLRPTLLVGRYKSPDLTRLWADILKWTLRDTRQVDVVLAGGEVAAARLTGTAIQGAVTVWAPDVPVRFVEDKELRLDPAGPITVLRKFWQFTTDTPCCSPQLLIYAELLAIGEPRTVEVARRLERQVFDRLPR